MDEGVLDLVFEDDGVEFVEEGADLFIHNDQFYSVIIKLC